MLTPEQARDLVEWAGSQRAAAKVAGVAQSTVHYWLHPDKAKRQTRRAIEWERNRYRTDPEFRERKLARNRDYYWREDAIRRGRRMLRVRRNKALQRRAQREQRRREVGALSAQGRD